jgi:DNA-binding response OmpR family regulator
VARVLIIEDDGAAGRLLQKHLEKSGHVVVVAPSGEAGLMVLGLHTTAVVTMPPTPREFLAGAVELVVCDLGLPGMSGVSVIEAIRAEQHTAGLPVLVVSGRTSMQDHALALEAGADHYLEKPLKLKVFDDLVRDLLAGARR